MPAHVSFDAVKAPHKGVSFFSLCLVSFLLLLDPGFTIGGTLAPLGPLVFRGPRNGRSRTAPVPMFAGLFCDCSPSAPRPALGLR